MLTVRTYVANSEIDGAGVFLAERVCAGQIVWVFDPIIDVEITAEQMASLPDAARELAMKHAFLNHDGRLILSRDNGVFFNHSEEPTTLNDGDVNIAARDLPAGTELTENYCQSFPLGACSEFLKSPIKGEAR